MLSARDAQVSDVDVRSDLDGVIHFDAEIAHGALQPECPSEWASYYASTIALKVKEPLRVLIALLADTTVSLARSVGMIQENGRRLRRHTQQIVEPV